MMPGAANLGSWQTTKQLARRDRAPVVKGTVVKSTVVKGTAVKGTVVKGTAIRDPATRGPAIRVQSSRGSGQSPGSRPGLPTRYWRSCRICSASTPVAALWFSAWAGSGTRSG